jgi:hypothetical protein
MTLSIDLTPDQEARLTAFARRKGLEPAALAKKLVTDHLPLSDSLNGMELSPEERIKAMDAFAEKNRGLPHLPDEAFDRENLYDERF